MKYSKFIVLDIETTGFDPKSDDAIEVSAVKLDADLTEIDRIDFLLKNQKPLSPLVSALTGITQDMLDNQPSLDDISADISEFVQDLPIVGHNINFDIDFLVAKGVDISGDRLDTLELAQTILPAQSGYGLEQLAHRWQFTNQPSHRAMNDVLATVDLFKLLISRVNLQTDAVRNEIRDLMADQDWAWLWLWSESPQVSLTFTGDGLLSEYSDYMVDNIVTSQLYLDKINTAVTGKVNLIESHLPGDTLAYNISYATSHAPSLLVVPSGLLRQLNWSLISEKTGSRISLCLPITFQFDSSNLVAVFKSTEDVTSVLVRLVIKLIIWDQLWDRNPTKLYLSSEEQYEWEQKFVDSNLDPSYEIPVDGTTVITTEMLTKVKNISDFEIVSGYPHTLEESFFDTQTRTLSVPYLNAAVSSRRDFVHREIVPTHPKVADELFKLLSQLGPKFNKLSDSLSQVYLNHPPTSVYEKDIDLSRDQVNPDFEKNIEEIVSVLDLYNQKIQGIGFSIDNNQVARTTRLIEHLVALKTFDTKFKYFLFAEENRFFLQIIPSLNIFENIRKLFLNAQKVVVISAGLVFNGSFSYWQYLFPEGVGKLVSGDALSGELINITDIDPEDNFQDIIKLVEKVIANGKNLLILHGSAYDSRVLFDELHAQLPSISDRITSLDTSGLSDKLPSVLANSKGRVVVVPIYWVERSAPSLKAFDLAIISKIAFEANGKPIAKLYRGDRSSFSAYTLPKSTLRMKENLHHLASFTGPIALMDPRLFSKDYGRDILDSLSGWKNTESNFASILDKV